MVFPWAWVDSGLLADAGEAERAALTGVGSTLLGLGLMALLLSAAGLYAVLSFGVASRTRDIGVRIALGASVLGIAGTIGRRVAVSLALGLVLGIGLGLLVFRVVQSFPFEVRVDPLLHLGTPGILLVVVGAASMIRPLQRALRIEPADALRVD